VKILNLTRARRVETETDRQKALSVLKETYQHEKAWVLDVEPMFPASDLQRGDVSWFLAMSREKPVGVLRVLYNPPLEQYASYGLKPISDDVDLDELIKSKDVAEIGRFAIVPERRKGIGVVTSLMRATMREVIERGYAQLVTDVFENDPHSPYGFHTRIVGFRPVATHEVGELRYIGRRITLVLDIKKAYQTLKASGNMFFRSITKGWSAGMHKRLAA
jgi:hypothetical protein